MAGGSDDFWGEGGVQLSGGLLLKKDEDDEYEDEFWHHRSGRCWAGELKKRRRYP